MTKILRSALAALALALTSGAPVAATVATVSLSGCATVPTKPLPKEQMEGSKWKLVISGGRMDHRVIEFKQEAGSYVGRLVEHGRILGEMVGIPDNMVMFKLRPLEAQGPNVYTGVYTTIQADGMPLEREVVVTFNDDGFIWNLESATWSRVQ